MSLLQKNMENRGLGRGLAGTVFVLLAALGLWGAAAQEDPDPSAFALAATVEGAIGPATTRYIENAIEEAETRGASVIVLRLNTPGGLVDATREIISAILDSRVPVVTYVAPSGAHAASAGTFILYASHVAAMAPGTNIGAATPVQIGGPGGQPAPGDEEDEGGEDGEAPAGQKSNRDALDLKSVNDAVAFIKSLAELHGRNAEWAERAVREAATLTANEALEQNVIEVVAGDVPDLLTQISGLSANMGSYQEVLETEGLRIEEFEPDFMTELLSLISNPNIAFILMMIGVYGLLLEFYSPGSIGPGVLGTISLILGLYALNQLPLDYAGAALILLGIAFMVAEAFTPTFGVLGIGGLAAFVIGAAMLIDTEQPEFQISWQVIAGTAAVSGAFFFWLLGYVWKTHRRPVASGKEHMVGAEAQVLEWSGNEGFVWAGGERWKAKGRGAKPGATVRIKGVEGLTLVVEPGADGNKPS